VVSLVYLRLRFVVWNRSHTRDINRSPVVAMPMYVQLVKFYNLREGPRSQGASRAVCGSGVPPYDFLNLYGISNSRFSGVFPKERLELKSLKGQTKAEEEGPPGEPRVHHEGTDPLLITISGTG
jgi:hypothetical protein